MVVRVKRPGVSITCFHTLALKRGLLITNVLVEHKVELSIIVGTITIAAMQGKQRVHWDRHRNLGCSFRCLLSVYFQPLFLLAFKKFKTTVILQYVATVTWWSFPNVAN